jgi:hypothetical protein
LDIVAEMRTRSREVKEAFGGRTDGVENMLDIWAERIQEIAKRERAPVGNAAALREALSDACYAMFNFLKTQNGGYEEMANALDKSKAALSAPARNCDRFADAESARQAWLDDADNWDDFGSPTLELYEWLFAPAEERKGEGDGR